MLDRTRLVVERRLGTDPVDASSSFQEGDLLHYGANGWAKSADGTAEAIRGIAGINRANTLYRAVVGESVVLTGTDNINLNHANLVADSERVTSADGSTVYVKGTDYNINYTNGTISRIPTGGIGDGDTVLVSYTYQMPLSEIESERGLPLNNNLDETLGSGQVVVFQGNMRIATTRYDTTKAYAVNDVLYDNGDGLLTSDGSGGKKAVGHVLNPPTASDPYLIAELNL